MTQNPLAGYISDTQRCFCIEGCSKRDTDCRERRAYTQQEINAIHNEAIDSACRVVALMVFPEGEGVARRIQRLKRKP